jgi:HEAT repeat protein
VALGHVAGEAGCAALRRFVTARSATSPYKPYRNDRTDRFTFDHASPLNPRTLQAAVRALGHRRDREALPLLERCLMGNLSRETGNLFLAEAAADALGCYENAPVATVLAEAFARLEPYHRYVGWYGDHEALWACHSSPLHVRISAALQRCRASVPHLVPALVRSLPTDPDRALLLGSDALEKLVGHLVRQSGRGPALIEACLAQLGDPAAVVPPDLEPAAPQRAGLDGADWIWHAADGATPPPGERRFRIAWDLPAGRKPLRALLSATADNSLAVTLNGIALCQSGDWQAVADADAGAALRAGANHLEVVARNGGDGPNPAGLMLRLVITCTSGEPLVIVTGKGAWESSTDGQGWAAVRRVGPLGCAPWGMPANASAKPTSTLFACHPAWAGTPDPGVRAAQVLSAVCDDPRFEPRIRAAFLRYAAEAEPRIKRSVGNNPSRPEELPRRNWILFYLARTLGQLGAAASTPDLLAVLAASPDEAHLGRPDPAQPNIHYLHLVCPPCWRAAVCWALGHAGDVRAVPTLLKVAGHLDNAVDVRHAAAEALDRLAQAEHAEALQRLAAAAPEVSVSRALATAARKAGAGRTEFSHAG